MRNVCLLALLILTSTGCIPINRSAKGLNAGELAITYQAPFAADIRYGFNEKIEGRIFGIYDGTGLSPGMDLNYHKPVGKYSGSITVGTHWIPRDEIRLGTAITLSREFSGKILVDYDANPYVGFSYSFPIKNTPVSSSLEYYYIAVGMETRLKFKHVDLLLIPEIQITPLDFDNSFYFWGSFGLGLVLNKQ